MTDSVREGDVDGEFCGMGAGVMGGRTDSIGLPVSQRGPGAPGREESSGDEGSDPSIEASDPDGETSSRPGSGTLPRTRPWLDHHNPVLTVTAAGVAPVLYLLFVNRYSVNSFNGDDWSVVLFVRPALNGHLRLSHLWSQYNESRLLVGNAVDVIFGFVDHLDLRAVIFFSAAVFIVSYVIVLALFRAYLRRPLTPLSVLVVGAVWFSVADVQNSLWAFQVSWYLTVFFVVSMLFALLVPEHHRTVWLTVGAVAALAGSFTTIQGFFCWPLGAICILWSRPGARRTVVEIVSWCAVVLSTVLLYLPGYNFNNNGCIPASSCSSSVAFHHPVTALRFLVALIGAVIPGGILDFFQPTHIVRFELVGAAILVVSLFIVIQSFRFRGSSERMPLPLLLITFSLVFDVTVTMGRSGTGPVGAASSNRYVMPNLILVVAILIYAWAHVPLHRSGPSTSKVHASLAYGAVLVLTVFLVVQVREATGFGLTNGSLQRSSMIESARLFVNLDRVPTDRRSCVVDSSLFFQPGAEPLFDEKLHGAAQGHLGQFQAIPYLYYRRLGPLALPSDCHPSG